jgi:hypothetical protein
MSRRQIGGIMTARLRNHYRPGNRRRRNIIERFGNGGLEKKRRGGRRCDTPFDVDRFVVVRVIDTRTGRCGRQVKVEVRRGRGRMVEFLRMNVEKGRLGEAPQQGSNAQNCGGRPHEFPNNLSSSGTGL